MLAEKALSIASDVPTSLRERVTLLPRLPTEPFLDVYRAPLFACSSSAGRSPSSNNARFSGFKIVPPPHAQKPAAAASNIPVHSEFRRASHGDPSCDPLFGDHSNRSQPRLHYLRPKACPPWAYRCISTGTPAFFSAM